MNRISPALEKLSALDLALCLHANRACGYSRVRALFAAVSWLGDGKFWYGLMLALPFLHGTAGFLVSLQMLLAGAVGLGVYRAIKHRTHRPRPFRAHTAVVRGAVALDEFSFPSGHTLHAVMFTLIVCAAFPYMAWLLAPFTALVAASRVVLGLHYPTDVLLGAVLGVALARGSAAVAALLASAG
ncbi:MAG: phosphatase PAP2 family protein [Gammaproteobacteria bacterium]